MARKSNIDKLPDELRKAIDEKLADPKLTLEQILAHVRELGVETSQSALHRRQQTIEAVGERIRRSKTIADALVERFGDAEDDRVARLNINFVHSAIMDMMGVADDNGEPITLSPMQAMALSKALNELARAKKTEADLVLKMRKEAAEKAVTAAVTEIKRAAPGLTADKVEAMRKAISERVLGA